MMHNVYFFRLLTNVACTPEEISLRYVLWDATWIFFHCLQEVEDKVISPEKAEEAKLKARYPNLGAKPGGSDFLRKRLQKGVRFKQSTTCSCKWYLCYSSVILSFCLSSKNILTLETTTWPRQKWRTNSCHQPQQRRQKSQGDTSRHLRTCLKERHQLWPANWLVDGFMGILLPFRSPFQIYLLFVCVYSSPLCLFFKNMLSTKYIENGNSRSVINWNSTWKWK